MRLCHRGARDRLPATRHILIREILPNVRAGADRAGHASKWASRSIVEAILSFVGLSVSSDTPTWGGMIAEGRQIHSSGLVGARGAAGGPVRHGARLQPARRRLAPRARSGAAPMSAPLLAIASSQRGFRSRPRPPILRDVSLDRRARRNASGWSARAAPANRPSPRRSSASSPRTVQVTDGEILFEGADLLTLSRVATARGARRATSR